MQRRSNFFNSHFELKLNNGAYKAPFFLFPSVKLLVKTLQFNLRKSGGAFTGRRPVYRILNLRNGAHVYTASNNEKTKLQATGNYYYEGIAYYVPK